MATKPTIADARWASDETNNTAPSSGQRDTGWTANQIAISSYFNQLAYEYYKWCLYLSDGAFTGAATFASTLGVTGLITATAGLTCAVNTHVTVSGTGKFKHGTRTKKVHWSEGIHQPTGVADDNGEFWKAVGSDFELETDSGGTIHSWFVPITLDVDERLLAVRARVKGHNTEFWTFTVKRSNGDGTATTIGAAPTSATGGGAVYETLTTGAVTETVGSGTTAYYAYLSPTAAGLFFSHLEVDYDRP